MDRWVESVSSLHRSLPPTLVGREGQEEGGTGGGREGEGGRGRERELGREGSHWGLQLGLVAPALIRHAFPPSLPPSFSPSLPLALQVTYPKPMPDLERLMQAWPAPVQAAVMEANEKVRSEGRKGRGEKGGREGGKIRAGTHSLISHTQSKADAGPVLPQLLPPSLDLSLEEYAKTACALFGIPVYENG